MKAWPRAITELVNQLARLPGIGEKTAARLALHILDAPGGYGDALAAAVQAVGREVHPCPVCHALTDAELCAICSDEDRDASVICVVQSFADLVAIERTAEFRGRYHVLRGLIRPLEGAGPESIGLDQLEARVREGVRELIIATSPSVEGEATAMYIRQRLAPFGIEVSRIARGLPLGSEVEYADRATLGRAMAARERF